MKLAGSSLTTGNTPREGAFNVNGLRSTFNNFLIDGVDNNAYGTSNQGFSNQVMQPAPDAIGEFKVVTNNMSAEYGRAAGATINVNYRSGTNAFHGSGWEFLRNTSMNATGFFKPANGKPELDRNQFGGVVGGPIVKNKAFFFGDYEGLRQTRKVTGFRASRRRRSARASSSVDVRDPRTGVVYPAGTAIPMTAFARKVLAALPDTNVPGNTNNYTTPAGVHRRLRQGRRQDRSAGDAEPLDVRPLRLPQPEDVRSAEHPAAVRRRRQRRTSTRATGSSCSARPGCRAGRRCSRRGSAIRGRRRGRTRRRSAPTARSKRSGCPGCRTIRRISGGLPTQVITGYSDLGRQATNPQWQYPTVYNPKINYTWTTQAHSFKTGYEFQRIDTEVQDVNPLYGRDTYNGRSRVPAGAAASNLYNLADFMLGLRAQYALSSVLVANLRRNMHFAYLQDDWRVGQQADAEPRAALRVLDAVLGEEQRPLELRSGGQRDRPGEGRIGLRPRAHRSGPQQLRSASRVCLHRGAGHGRSAAATASATCTSAAPAAATSCRSTARRSSTRSSTRRNPTAASFVPAEQGYPAGLADPSQFNPLTANITYMPRDFHSSPVQSWYISVQRELRRNMLLDVAYVGNRADDLLLFANYNQAVAEQRRRHHRAAGPPPDQRLRRHHLRVQRRQVALQSAADQVRVAHEPRLTILSSLTLSETKDNGAQSLENSNGNFPAPQDFRNLDADFGLSNYHQPYNSTTSFVWTLPFGSGQRWGSALAAGRCVDRRLAAAGHQHGSTPVSR